MNMYSVLHLINIAMLFSTLRFTRIVFSIISRCKFKPISEPDGNNNDISKHRCKSTAARCFYTNQVSEIVPNVYFEVSVHTLLKSTTHALLRDMRANNRV
jgi:hypothetical protein